MGKEPVVCYLLGVIYYEMSVDLAKNNYRRLMEKHIKKGQSNGTINLTEYVFFIEIQIFCYQSTTKIMNVQQSSKQLQYTNALRITTDMIE